MKLIVGNYTFIQGFRREPINIELSNLKNIATFKTFYPLSAASFSETFTDAPGMTQQTNCQLKQVCNSVQPETYEPHSVSLQHNQAKCNSLIHFSRSKAHFVLFSFTNYKITGVLLLAETVLSYPFSTSPANVFLPLFDHLELLMKPDEDQISCSSTVLFSKTSKERDFCLH